MKKLRKESSSDNSEKSESDNSEEDHRYRKGHSNKTKKNNKNAKTAKVSDNEEELANSRIKYNKLAEKAMKEIGPITSEDEESIIMKKRQHMVNSIRKEFPEKSKRLEAMLKNAALNNDESIELTPSSHSSSRIMPEKEPQPYPYPKNPMMIPEKEYSHNSMYQHHNFYPEATFNAHQSFRHQPPMSYTPHVTHSYAYNPLTHSQDQSFYAHKTPYSAQYPNNPQFPPTHMGPNPNYSNFQESKDMVFGYSKNSRTDLYDDKLFDLIDQIETEGDN